MTITHAPPLPEEEVRAVADIIADGVHADLPSEEVARSVLVRMCKAPPLPEEIAGLIEALEDYAKKFIATDSLQLLSLDYVLEWKAAAALRALAQENEKLRTPQMPPDFENILDGANRIQERRFRELEAENKRLQRTLNNAVKGAAKLLGHIRELESERDYQIKDKGEIVRALSERIRELEAERDDCKRVAENLATNQTTASLNTMERVTALEHIIRELEDERDEWKQTAELATSMHASSVAAVQSQCEEGDSTLQRLTHIAAFTKCMTRDNWADMQLHIERQVQEIIADRRVLAKPGAERIRELKDECDRLTTVIIDGQDRCDAIRRKTIEECELAVASLNVRYDTPTITAAILAIRALAQAETGAPSEDKA